MNIVLFEPGEPSGGRLRLTDRRFTHIRKVLRSRQGDELVVGQLHGRLGRGTVLEIDSVGVELKVELTREPPPPLPVELAVALPRPPSLRKVLQQATALGVKRVGLFHSARVVKSFWQSSTLRSAELAHQLRLGLEQGRDTRPPEVQLHRSFRRFAEDVLPRWAEGRTVLLGEAGAAAPPVRPAYPTLLIIGPEGGFLPQEAEELIRAGAAPVGLGERPLRVETAVVALLGALLARG